jgi:DNA mismatch endonuclease (patch repair protein)
MPDFLTRRERSALMSRIRSKDTSPERTIRSMLHVAGYRFRKHLRKLPGSPDIVFVSLKVAIFVDGDFWHGYRFSKWKHKLSDYWVLKIENNRKRDKRVFARLRRNGWRVLRIWEHELKKTPKAAFERIVACLSAA